MNFSPKDYNELLDYITEYERTDYMRLTLQLADGHITEDWFNKQHQELFEKLAKRKQDCKDMMIERLPPKYHSLMYDHQHKEYYEMIVAFKRGYITQSEFNDYHKDVIKDLQSKVENAEQNDRLMNSKDDQISIKFFGAAHARDRVPVYDIVNKGDVLVKGKNNFFDRYQRKVKKKDDPRQASTFYNV